MKVISLFNHKGGVSKTTTSFNLGWMLANKGHKTLIVDADPQCNLTALVLDYNSIDEFNSFYENNPNSDLSSGLGSIMNGRLEELKAGDPIQTKNENLYLYCGNLEVAEVETQISVALTTSIALPALKNLPGSIGELLRVTAKKHDFEYVIIDMSPSIGALNQCLLMSSDYFIVPTSPDFFCAQAIKSLARVLPKWNSDLEPFRKKDIKYAIPDSPPKFLGFISQRYRPRNSAPARSFQRWIDTIIETVNEGLVPVLQPLNMVINADLFSRCCAPIEGYNLANIADFNSLIAQSHQHNVPVYSLTDEQINQSGNVLSTMKENRDDFYNTFNDMAEKIICLTK